jgi:hypothetical protein
MATKTIRLGKSATAYLEGGRVIGYVIPLQSTKQISKENEGQVKLKAGEITCTSRSSFNYPISEYSKIIRMTNQQFLELQKIFENERAKILKGSKHISDINFQYHMSGKIDMFEAEVSVFYDCSKHVAGLNQARKEVERVGNKISDTISNKLMNLSRLARR